MSTTLPLPTVAATVTPAGISAPSFALALSSWQASYSGIYGSDVVLTADSQDGQWLGIQEAAVNDCNMAAIFVYNQFSPATAQGVGLSSVVKINGLTRQASSNSTAVVTITGQAFSAISDGLVGDNQNLGTQWALPSLVTIP